MNRGRRQVYVILSVDTEHDVTSLKYRTKTAGWSKGIPLLFEVFDDSGVRGKVCWLIEHNLKEGIVAANPDSVFFVKEFPAIIEQIKDRGDELGLHPTMFDWLGGEGNIPVSSYGDPRFWDFNRSYLDPGFVMESITSGTSEFKKVCGANPVGCRTSDLHYATHLATALEKNLIYMDSSVPRRLRHWRVAAPNAYYAARDDIRNKITAGTRVLEIPVTGCIGDGWIAPFLKLRSRLLLESREPIFLSFYMHNWQAVTTGGEVDRQYLKFLSSFLRLLSGHGATFLSWTQAYNTYADIYGHSFVKEDVYTA